MHDTQIRRVALEGIHCLLRSNIAECYLIKNLRSVANWATSAQIQVTQRVILVAQLKNKGQMEMIVTKVVTLPVSASR